jgi:lipoprotein-anchoring transpeptidase ErfK/SrfK
MASIDRIEIDIARQQLRTFSGARELRCYTVSTARNGAGELMDSERTPRGAHEVAEKIGAGCAPDTVFVARRATGEIYDAELAARHPGRDWILTRILWLAGRDHGYNSGGERDTKARYIYIHGTPDSTTLGQPGSRGCIRMRNADIVELFDAVAVGTRVDIVE